MPIVNCTIDQRKSWYKVYIEYTVVQDILNKQSTVSHSLKLKQLTDSGDFSGAMNVTYTINGKSFTYNANFDINNKYNAGHVFTIKSGNTIVDHDEITGDAIITLSCAGSCNSGGYGPGDIELSKTQISLPRIPLYSLTSSIGENSHIVVNRISSGGSGSSGVIADGDNVLYYGDQLKISFSANANYIVSSHNVNGLPFTSGNTHIVSNDVSIVSLASPLISTVGASDAMIGSTSIISITSYSSSFTHTLEYTFGTLSGVIALQTPNTSLAWTVPDIFYEAIPNSKSGICHIKCSTYNGESLLGENTCSIFVSVPEVSCMPILQGTVVDINPATCSLTGDNSILIRYMSIAECHILSTAQNGSTIMSESINGLPPNDEGKLIFNEISSSDFVFTAIDSRGLCTTESVSPSIIPYIPLTINPVFSRPSPTGNEMTMSFTGNYYNGSLGAYANSLSIRYRYRESSSGSFTPWVTVSPTNFFVGTNSYSSIGKVSLDGDFSYMKSYIFEVEATDGTSEYPLSVVNKVVPVSRGVPIFDWGENDFCFNVPVFIEGISIFDLFYPIGSIYMRNEGVLPETFSNYGAWEEIQLGFEGVYAWSRTS